MKRLIRLACVAIALLQAPHAAGHGTSIQIQPVAPGDSLSATGEILDVHGFAPEIFVEDDEDGDPLPTPTFLQTLGAIRLWRIPGLSISGMNNSSSLSIEVMARPVKDSSPLEQRVLWYWNPTNGLVEEAATNLYLLSRPA